MLDCCKRRRKANNLEREGKLPLKRRNSVRIGSLFSFTAGSVRPAVFLRHLLETFS
jgi:hypothetical protein